MKRKSLNIFIALMAAMVLTALSACGDGGGAATGDGDAAAGNGGAAAGANADFVRTDWRQPFPETVTVTIANDDMAHATFPDGYDIFNNLWTERWLELYNVNVVTVWASADRELQTNLAIAAGDIPDMMFVNSVQFVQMLDANLIEDITYAVRNYSSPALERMLSNEQLVFNTAMRNGRYYSIPQMHYGFITQSPYLWIRRDWYEEIGSPNIETLADLENMMALLTETFDEIEHVMSLHDGLDSFRMSTPVWHAHTWGGGGGSRMWIDGPDGSIVSAFEQPEFFDVLTAWNRWYELGWIRPDFATIDFDGTNADIVSGRSAMAFGQNWRGWTWNSVVEEFDEDAYLMVLPMPSVDGVQPRIPITFANYAYNVVRRGFEHPEILPMLISDYIYLLTEAPVTGSMTMDEILPFNSNEMHHTSGPFKITFAHYDDVNEVLNAMDAFHAGTLDDFQFTSGYAVIYVEEILRWVAERDIAGFGRFSQMGHRDSALAMGVQYEDNGQFLYTRSWGQHPQEVLDFGGITDSIITEGVTRIIMGLDPLEHWWVVLEDWRQAGGNEMTAAVNAYYGN